MEVFVGSINMFGFPFAPVDWAICQGQILPVSEYAALYSLIGNRYGGSGTMLALPDLRGRLPMGQGIGRGLTPREIGTYTGQEGFFLTPNQCALQSHVHPATMDVSNINVTSKLNVSTGAGTDTPTAGGTLSKSGGGPGQATIFTTSPSSPVALDGIANTVSGSGSATVEPNNPVTPSEMVNVINPALVVNFCIALMGLYPTRN